MIREDHSIDQRQINANAALDGARSRGEAWYSVISTCDVHIESYSAISDKRMEGLGVYEILGLLETAQCRLMQDVRSLIDKAPTPEDRKAWIEHFNKHALHPKEALEP